MIKCLAESFHGINQTFAVGFLVEFIDSLPLLSLGTLSSSSKSYIILLYLSRKMSQLWSYKLINKYRHFTTVTVCRPDNNQDHCGLGKNVYVRSSALFTINVQGNGHCVLWF